MTSLLPASTAATSEGPEQPPRGPEGPSGATGNLDSLMVEHAPPPHPKETFVAAVRELLRRFGEQADVSYELENRMRGEPDSTVATAAYLILQEALSNVGKHAGAHRLTVALASDGLGHTACVRDYGQGFESHRALGPGTGQRGLCSMRERAERLGGWLDVLSKPGSGTTVLFWLPSVP